MRVLLIEDDVLLGESMEDYLKKIGFDIKWIDDDRIVMQILSIELFDVVILDLMLKFSKGEDLIKKIKDTVPDVPIVITTAKDGIKSKEECFGLGADDYLVKPFDPKELVLRIKAVCSRYYNIDEKQKIGNMEIDVKNKTVKKNGDEIILTKREWDILIFLLKKRGKIVTHTDILNYVWADSDVNEESVRTYIKKLRAILPDNAIETHKGRGYRLK